MNCPACQSEQVVFALVGHDNFGAIRELRCLDCNWSEGDELGESIDEEIESDL